MNLQAYICSVLRSAGSRSLPLSSLGVLWGPGLGNAHAYMYRPFISASAATVGSQCLAAKMGLCGARRFESPKATGRIPPWRAAIRRFGSHRSSPFKTPLWLSSSVSTHALQSCYAVPLIWSGYFFFIF